MFKHSPGPDLTDPDRHARLLLVQLKAESIAVTRCVYEKYI